MTTLQDKNLVEPKIYLLVTPSANATGSSRFNHSLQGPFESRAKAQKLKDEMEKLQDDYVFTILIEAI